MRESGLERRGDGSRSAAARRHRSGPLRADSMREFRSTLVARLRDRLTELQSAISTRVYAISDPRAVTDSAYPQELDGAVAAAIAHRLAVLEGGESHAPPVPPVLLAQARLDARDGVSLDTVLRRYFAGNALFGDFLVEEAEAARVPNPALRRLLSEQATLGDRLLAAVSAEHAQEEARRPRSAADRRRECVKGLLAGELVDDSELGYDLDAHHLALMARGDGAEEMLRALAGTLDRSLLVVHREEEPICAAWLGGGSPLPAEDAIRALSTAPDGVSVAVGEPAEALAGWRFTHFQAKAALPLAERRSERIVRYADVAVLASVLRDDLVAGSLRQLYLAPLERSRDRGRAARETLRAYFAADRNVSSTAAALGVDRRTVSNRIRAVEELLGRPLSASAADLEIALRLDD